jgi:hypothetical protein
LTGNLRVLFPTDKERDGPLGRGVAAKRKKRKTVTRSRTARASRAKRGGENSVSTNAQAQGLGVERGRKVQKKLAGRFQPRLDGVREFARDF